MNLDTRKMTVLIDGEQFGFDDELEVEFDFTPEVKDINTIWQDEDFKIITVTCAGRQVKDNFDHWPYSESLEDELRKVM